MICLLCSKKGIVEVNTPGGTIYLCDKHQRDYLRLLTSLRIDFDARLVKGEDVGKEKSSEEA